MNIFRQKTAAEFIQMPNVITIEQSQGKLYCRKACSLHIIYIGGTNYRPLKKDPVKALARGYFY